MGQRSASSIRSCRVQRSLPPPVHIEQVTADDKIYDATNGLRLPPRIRNLAINYTALSFVAPEKVRFRYMLEGQNRNWHDGRQRTPEVQYTNLAPGTYRFRVAASNNSGVWNEAGAVLDFSIAAAYYQTRWFAAMVALGSCRCYGRRTNCGSVRSRISSIGRWTRGSASGRASRASCTIRCCKACRVCSSDFRRRRTFSRHDPPKRKSDSRPPSIRQKRRSPRGETRCTGCEHRRSPSTTSPTASRRSALNSRAILSAVEPPAIDIEMEGPSRNLNPVVREEAYRIAAEALRNAFKHAQARRIRVIIRYEARQFRLTVRDDGKGMDAETIQRQQVAGHFGLPGMRERAAIVKGRLDLHSEPGSGTEIELTIPGAVAYGAAAHAPSPSPSEPT